MLRVDKEVSGRGYGEIGDGPRTSVMRNDGERARSSQNSGKKEQQQPKGKRKIDKYGRETWGLEPGVISKLQASKTPNKIPQKTPRMISTGGKKV